MKFYSHLFICFLVISACGLDASQEKTLNSAVSKYLFATNSDLKLSRASYIHPSVLKYYKSKGHKEFKNYFLKEEMIWTDAVFGRMASKGNLIQVELKIAQKTEAYSKPEKTRISLYALSEDNGSSWFFVENNDYKCKECRKFKRLIK